MMNYAVISSKKIKQWRSISSGKSRVVVVEESSATRQGGMEGGRSASGVEGALMCGTTSDQQ